MGRRPVHVVGLNSTNSTRSSSQTVRMVCSQRASMASVNTLRRYLVTNTRCACRKPRCGDWGDRSGLSVGGPRSVVMQMRYRYRIEPTGSQGDMLGRVFGCCRVVFNDALRVRDEAYRAGVKLPDSEVQRRVITHAKTTVERGWLCRCPVWRWCSRSTTLGGRGATSSTRPRVSGGAPRSGGRGSSRGRIIGSRFDSPATASA